VPKSRAATPNGDGAAAREPERQLADKEGAALAERRVYYTLQYENVGTGDALACSCSTAIAALRRTHTGHAGGGSYDAAASCWQWNIGTRAEAEGRGHLQRKLASTWRWAPRSATRPSVFPSALEITPTTSSSVIGTVARTQDGERGFRRRVAVTLSRRPGRWPTSLLGEPLYGVLTGRRRISPTLRRRALAPTVSYRISSGGRQQRAKVARRGR